MRKLIILILCLSCFACGGENHDSKLKNIFDDSNVPLNITYAVQSYLSDIDPNFIIVETAIVIYMDQNSITEEFVTLPWSYSFIGHHGDYLYLSAQPECYSDDESIQFFFDICAMYGGQLNDLDLIIKKNGKEFIKKSTCVDFGNDPNVVCDEREIGARLP